MRLVVALAFVLLFIDADLYGQKKRFSVGVKAGLNLSNAKEDFNAYAIGGDKKAQWGYEVGFLTDYAVTDAFYLQSGLSLTAKGTRHQGAEVWIGSVTPPVTYWNVTTNQTYLQLPLLFGYKIALSNQAKIRVNAGPYVAYGIGGREIVTEKTLPASVRAEERFTSHTFREDDRKYAPFNLKREDYGISAGLGIEYRKVLLGFACEVGLFNIAKAKEREVAPLEVAYRNRNLSVTIGYLF